MIVKLLTEHHLEFLSLVGGCTGSSGSTLVKMSSCWKSRAAALMVASRGQQRLGSDWTNALSDLSLYWAHSASFSDSFSVI